MRFWSIFSTLRNAEGEANGGGGGGETPAEGGQEAPPAWFASYAEKIDKRLGDMGRQLAKTHEARKGKGGGETETKPEAGGKPEGGSRTGPTTEDVRKEMLIARRYGEVLSKLPEKARQRLEQMEEEGRSFADLFDAATLALDLQGDAASNGQERQTTPRGHGGTPAAPAVSDDWPRNWTEAQKLRREDPKKLDRMIDRGLDLNRLPRS